MHRLVGYLLFVSSLYCHAAPTVTTEFGKVSGELDNGIAIFKGIPFAAPPIGELRWAPPVPTEPWEETLSATEFGHACSQPQRPDRQRNFGPQSEDCLTLNIWAPKQAKNAPVMVWIHGGAFRVGKGGTPFYDGIKFAEQGVVLVSINYRLGYLGFFAHPGLSESSPDTLLGNYGLLDQIAALQWVHNNISNFGGAPDKVTIFGESAGGSSVLYLMTIKDSAGLYQQAVVQSGGGLGSARYLHKDLPNVPSLESVGRSVVKQLGLQETTDIVAKLRAIPASELIERANSFENQNIGFGPVIDGKLISRSVYSAFAAGEVARIPLIIGANSNEASVLKAFGANSRSVLQRLGEDAAKAGQLYQAEAGDDVDYMTDLIWGDAVFVGPARAIARLHSMTAPVYQYHLDYVREKARDQVKGANHGADVILVFDSLDALPMSSMLFTDRDRLVAQNLNQYWANFARKADPNSSNLPRWPAYSVETDQLLVIGNDNIKATANYRKEKLDLVMNVLSRNAATAD